MYTIHYIHEDGAEALGGTHRSSADAMQEAREVREATGHGVRIVDSNGRDVIRWVRRDSVLDYVAHSIDGDIPFEAENDEAAMKWVNEGDWSDASPFPVTQDDREVGWADPDAEGENDA